VKRPSSQVLALWSSYEAAVPALPDLPAARAAFAELRRRRDADAGRLSAVGDLVVVVSSSRGGSTLLGELLRHCPDLLHLRAEVNPLFVAAGLEPPARRTAVLAEEISVDVGRPSAVLPPEEVDDFAATLAWRLTAQWPLAGIDGDGVIRRVKETLAELAAADDRWAPPAFPDRVTFHLRLLARLRAGHPEVDPWYYDLPEVAVRRAFPDVPPPAGPPGDALVEMPPFVSVRPWSRPDDNDLARSTLVLATPRNAFRLDFFRRLFPSARLRVIHLTRNPAAAVNGLADGWRHRGFFNRPVDLELSIAGYSDVFPAWGRRWWNYDFWPGWEGWTGASLVRVCAEQWRSHHAAVFAFLAEEPVPCFRLRYEDLLASPARRRQAFADLAAWLGHDEIAALGDVSLPPLMATAPPRPRRWEANAAALEPVLADEGVADMAARLGYEDRADWV
jgi:hypothetical protein